MTINCIYAIIIVLLSIGHSYGQRQLSTNSKKAVALYQEADNYRVRGQYIQAARLLEQAIAKDKKFHEAYFRLAVIKKAQGKLDQAEQLLLSVISLNDGGNGPSYFELGELNLKKNNYQKAIDYINQYLNLNPRNRNRVAEAQTILNNAQFALDHQSKIAEFRPKPLNEKVNQFTMQYFPVVSVDGNTLIYTRRLGESFNDDEDLVIANYEGNDWGEPKSLSKNINTQNNEGTCTLSADGRTLIFTSCFGRPGFGSCDLFISYRIGGEWTKPENLGPNVNSSAWESQPSLSADGRTLYYISNRKGGLGGRDIWISSKNDNGEWSKPRNAGNVINTVRDEVSPFIHPNNKVLYYSTNGLPGFGGFDIYYSVDKGGWQKPLNIGAPINDGQDQVSLFITSNGTKAYYSNEDNNSKNKGIIYEVDISQLHTIEYNTSWVFGRITDSKTNEPLKSNITLFDINSGQRNSYVQSDSITGEYLMVLTEGSEYALYIDRSGYLFKSYQFNYAQEEDIEPIEINIQLDPIEKGKQTTLNNIFFETDKYELNPKSFTELEKVMTFLKVNPKVKIQIIGHTDAQGNKEYNKDLSQRRANSVFKYLTNKGISANRISTLGMGDKEPISDNNTELGRSKNRRIEFKIVEF